MNGFDLPDGELQLWWTSLDVDEPELEKLRGVLAPAELQRAARFRVPRAARRFTASRAALRTVLSRATGIAPADVNFRFGRHGKPHLADGGPYFNASDSGDRVVVALASAEVGVDIEVERELQRSDRLARRICTDHEFEMLAGLPDHERNTLVHRLWTCKEAALKAVGTGLPGGVRNVEVELPRNGAPRLPRLPGTDSNWTLLFPELEPNLLCTVVVRGQGWRAVGRPFSLQST